MKRGQGSEFISIILLVVLLVTLLLVAKLSSAKRGIAETEIVVDDYSDRYVFGSSTKFPFITEKGIPINEMLGVYYCYNKTVADYGDLVGTIDIDNAIVKTLDLYYEPGKWNLEIGGYACLDSSGLTGPPNVPADTITRCPGFPGKEYEVRHVVYPLPCRIGMGTARLMIQR